MYKKIIIQLLLLSLLIAITIFIFFSYFNKEESLKESNRIINKKLEPEIDEETSTLIKNLKYSFTDATGNNYEILAKLGKIDINNPDKIFMTSVIANVFLKESSPVKIISKYAHYNKNNHETNFFEDVKVTYEIHEATSENLDLSFTNNLATMYNNIIYNKPGTKLTADRLEIDLISKNSKIFMDNSFEKIKITDKK